MLDFKADLERDAQATVAAAVDLLRAEPGAVVAAPSSSITKQVLARIDPIQVTTEPRSAQVGICGADAVSMSGILNIVGARELAEAMPAIVITTRTRIVPDEVFMEMESPLFERIPLSLFSKFVIGGKIFLLQELESALGEAAARSR